MLYNSKIVRKPQDDRDNHQRQYKGYAAQKKVYTIEEEEHSTERKRR
jgi:hypothetical protein